MRENPVLGIAIAEPEFGEEKGDVDSDEEKV